MFRKKPQIINQISPDPPKWWTSRLTYDRVLEVPPYCKNHGCKLEYSVTTNKIGYDEMTGIANMEEIENWNCPYSYGIGPYNRELFCGISQYYRIARTYRDDSIPSECVGKEARDGDIV